MTHKKTVALVILIVTFIVIYTQVTFFVIPPVGAMPEGRTVVITRLNKTEFIDSPDAICERIQGGVSLLCRGMVMGTVVNNSTILMRLPYSSWLYSISTGGKTYDR
jgi:hypothetical protein